MSAFLALFASFWSRLATGALWAGALAFLGPIGPIVSGVAQVIGGVLTAAVEILVSLSKSPEGRVALCLLAVGLGFLYLRFHYIEEGRADARAKIAALHKPCAAATEPRRRR